MRPSRGVVQALAATLRPCRPERTRRGGALRGREAAHAGGRRAGDLLARRGDVLEYWARAAMAQSNYDLLSDHEAIT